ncbi:MAG TPA: hypothetical protein QF555_00870 [Candidatus Thalassarchaeaceae archaeon]|nr:hypothetical protein [Candidatus Thalassarchaeaceae archaeon]
MSRKVGLVLFLVSMFLLGTSTWTPEYESLDFQKSYAPIEIDNGNGTWTIQYQDDGTGGFSDASIRSDLPTQVNTSSETITFGSDPLNGTHERGLFGLDLSTVGFWNNATIVEASLELTIHTAPSIETSVMGFMTYRDWVDPSWNGATPAVPWTQPGADSNSDSGGPDTFVVTDSSSTTLSLDVTENLRVGQARNAQGNGGFVGVMVMGAAWNNDSYLPWSMSVFSSDASLSFVRPTWNILVQWSNPPTLSSVDPEWVDIEPRFGQASADSDTPMKAQVRHADGSISSSPVNWILMGGTGSVDPSGLFTPQSSGLEFVCAETINGKTSCILLLVTPGAPVSMSISPSNATFPVGVEIQLSALYSDMKGNEFPATPQWSADAGTIHSNGTFEITEVGTHRVDASAAGLTAWTNVTLVAGIPAALLMPQNLTVSSGERVSVLPTAVDGLGNPVELALAGELTYTVNSGTVDFSGMYTGAAVGTWTIDCQATLGASGSTEVEVTVGDPLSISLVHPNRTVSADEAVPIPVLWIDAFGNEVEMQIPLSAWTTEDGGFRNGENGTTEWLPRDIGTYWVRVDYENLTDTIDIEVGPGSISSVLIDSDSTTLQAGEESFLQMKAQDSLGNQRILDAVWSNSAEGPNPVIFANGATFTPLQIGSVTLQAVATEDGVQYTATRTFDVIPGRLVRISFEGDGITMTTDDSLDLLPTGFDSLDNPITGLQFNWTVNGEDMTSEIRDAGNVFMPTIVGDVQIEGMAAGRAARVDLLVLSGLPQSLSISHDFANGQLPGGSTVILTVLGVDLAGNENPIDGVTWSILEDAGKIIPGDSPGEYLFEVGKTGSWTLIARKGVADVTLSITVEPGVPDRISIEIDEDKRSSLSEGDVVDFGVLVLDASGNLISVPPSQIVVETKVGDAEHLQSNIWRIEIDGYGENVPFTVKYLELEQTIYVTASPSALSMLTDSTMGQIALGSVSVVLLLAVMLVLLPRFRNEADEIYEDEPSSEESIAPSPPPAGVSFSAPPSSAFSTSSHRRGRHRSSAPMTPSWGASQDRQNSANMAAMGASNSISQQTQMNKTPQTNIQPAISDPIQAPPRPKGLDNEEDAVQEKPAKEVNIVSMPENQVQEEPVSTGVMTACEGTVQGQTGWYHDGVGNTSYWQVDEGGTWTRLG